MIRPCAAWAKRSARFFQAGPERRRRHEGTHTSAVHHLWRGQGGDDMAHIPITAESRSIPARSRASLFQQRISSRSEEHTSELQSLMRISYAVFCLKKKKKYNKQEYIITN